MKSRHVVLLAGVLLVAANMRPSITCVGPLLPMIRTSTHLSGAGAGTLNTLPLLAFGGVSAIAPRFGRLVGLERALFAALLVTIAGTLIRSVPSTVALFVGTAILGSGIALANVLLPGLVKRDFPARVPVMTAAYATTMSLVAAISSGIAVPIADSAPGGWRTALGCWAALAVVGLIAWIPQLRGDTPPPDGAHAGGVWRSALAWQVTAFMGLQSFGFYVVITWLPSILESHGYSAASAGFELFLFQIVSLISSALMPSFAHGRRDQRVAAAVSSALGLIGFIGLIAAPGLAPVWVVVAGFGTGGCLTLALSFFALRAGDTAQAAALSGMAQSMGYLFAASGPVLIGVLHDSTSAWVLPLAVLAVTAFLQVGAGFAAGRARTIGTAWKVTGELATEGAPVHDAD